MAETRQREAEILMAKGLKALADGNTLSALSYFEKATHIEKSPIICSHLAFCLAKERGQLRQAIELCKEAIAKEPENSDHYLNLGRIYLLAEKRADAINAFREGLSHGENQQIIRVLEKLGVRRPPLIAFLKRSSPINKYLGLLLKRLGLR